jgi:hypothetical protein
MVLVGLSLTPTLVVQIAPAVNELKYASQAFMSESVGDGDDRTEGMTGLGRFSRTSPSK